MNEFNRPASTRLFQAVGTALMGVLVFLACWRMTHYIGIQNRNVSTAIATSRDQIDQGRPISENYEKFLGALVEYLKATRDQNVVILMQRSGVPVRVQDAPAPPSTGQTTGATQQGTSPAPAQKR